MTNLLAVEHVDNIVGADPVQEEHLGNDVRRGRDQLAARHVPTDGSHDTLNVGSAKLLATTQYGPAAPRMVISLSTGAKDRDLMLKEAGGGCCAAVWYAASLLVSAPPSD
jgi:hypothetical protein